MSGDEATGDLEGVIFDLDTFAVHDGPGIRLTVYLKGCPLACRWCHSPESQRPEPELIFLHERCVQCGGCAAACPEGAHRIADGQHRIARSICRACGRCAGVCPRGALALKGYRITAGEVIRRARRLVPFFRHSGGGITLTGGEVALQPDFAVAVLQGCQAAGIHTAIETSGACSWPTLQRLLAHTDLVLYDLKLADEAAHRHWTGASNRQILANAARLAGHNVQVRVPLIPSITDHEENLSRIFQFMGSAGLSRVALLACNPAAGAKYEWLGRSFPLQLAPQSRERLQELLSLARAAGLEAELG